MPCWSFLSSCCWSKITTSLSGRTVAMSTQVALFAALSRELRVFLGAPQTAATNLVHSKPDHYLSRSNEMRLSALTLLLRSRIGTTKTCTQGPHCPDSVGAPREQDILVRRATSSASQPSLRAGTSTHSISCASTQNLTSRTWYTAGVTREKVLVSPSAPAGFGVTPAMRLRVVRSVLAPGAVSAAPTVSLDDLYEGSLTLNSTIFL